MHFCPSCGQKNRATRLPVSSFLNDFFQDYFAFDSRLLKSLHYLLLKPGLMTRRFNEGKRLQFIPPMRMYIFITFIYFFLLAIAAPAERFGFEVNGQQAAPADSLTMALPDSLTPPVGGDSAVRESPMVVSFGEDYDTTGSRWAQRFEERIRWLGSHPDAFKQTVFRSISISVFFLLPLFALLLRMAHFRSRPWYVEHLVFSVHFHAFAFVLFLVMLVAGHLGWENYGLLVPVSFIYFVLALRNAYQQTFMRALLKALVIVPVYTVIISAVLLLALGLGIFIA